MPCLIRRLPGHVVLHLDTLFQYACISEYGACKRKMFRLSACWQYAVQLKKLDVSSDAKPWPEASAQFSTH
jgi:hypothetical protein